MRNRSTAALAPCFEHMSWGAIISGMIVAVMVGSLFNLLGIGIGLIAFSPDQTQSIGVGTVIWLIFSTLLYSILGGWVAGYFSHTRRSQGILNGFLAWSLATIFALLVISTSAGAIFNSAIQIVGRPLHSAQTLSLLSNGNLMSGTNRNQFAQLRNPAVDRQSQTSTNTDQPTTQKVEQATNVLGGAALMTFIILLIGAVAALIGGFWGTVSRDRLEREIE